MKRNIILFTLLTLPLTFSIAYSKNSKLKDFMLTPQHSIADLQDNRVHIPKNLKPKKKVKPNPFEHDFSLSSGSSSVSTSTDFKSAPYTGSMGSSEFIHNSW